MVVYKNIKDFLKNYKNDIVLFCVANNGINEMTLNLVKSCKSNNEDIVVFALDNDVSKYFEKHCDVVNYFVELGGGKIYEYETENFKKIAYYRFFILDEILNANKQIIYLDTDIYINKHFSDDIKKELVKYEFVIQTNGKNCCTGFFAIKPTEKTKVFFNKKNFESKNYLDDLDQNFVNREIYDKNIFKLKLLDIKLYPNGKYYYENCKKIEKNCYLIHFNNLIGYDVKINKMKEFKKWNI